MKMTTLSVELLIPAGTDMDDVTKRALDAVDEHGMMDGDVRVIIHHDGDCTARPSMDISRCTCTTLMVEARVLTPKESTHIMASGEYHVLVEDDPEVSPNAN